MKKRAMVLVLTGVVAGLALGIVCCGLRRNSQPYDDHGVHLWQCSGQPCAACQWHDPWNDPVTPNERVYEWDGIILNILPQVLVGGGTFGLIAYLDYRRRRPTNPSSPAPGRYAR